MKILSFDVGIKNLAYCYSDHTNNNISILDWNVIDLVKNNNMCYHDNCHKPIKYFINDIYSCKKHASCHSDYFINHTQLSINHIKKMQSNDIKKLCLSYNLEENKYKTRMINTLNSFFKEKCFKLYKQENATKIDLINIGRKMASIFDSLFNSLDIDIILIENQMSKIATRMKTIQGMITQYFIIKYPSVTIKYISSFNKLKFYSEDKKLSYKERKLLAIKTVNEIINKDHSLKNWCTLFSKHSKKDDLADCLLQSIIYMRLT